MCTIDYKSYDAYTKWIAVHPNKLPISIPNNTNECEEFILVEQLKNEVLSNEQRRQLIEDGIRKSEFVFV
jgi:hypothetical protein